MEGARAAQGRSIGHTLDRSPQDRANRRGTRWTHNLVKIHPSFIKIVEEVAHHLPELMFRCCGMFAAVRPPDEPTLRRTEQSVASKKRGLAKGWEACFSGVLLAAVSDHAPPHRCTRCGRRRASTLANSIVARAGMLLKSNRPGVALIHHPHRYING